MNPFGALMQEIKSRPGDPRGAEAVHLSVVKKQREAAGARVHLMEDDEPAPARAAPPTPAAPAPKSKPATREPEGACVVSLPAGTLMAEVFFPKLTASQRTSIAKPQEQPMAYEPRGKVAILAEAMRGGPGRIWSTKEVARLMDVKESAVGSHLDTAIRHGAIFRKLENGRCQYALRPFLPAPPPAPQEPRIPVFSDWRPAPMGASRGEPQQLAPGPAAPSTPAPAPNLPTCAISQTDPKCLTTPKEAEPEFNAALWADGDLVIYGAQENDDGSFTLNAAQTAKLCRLLHGQGPEA